MKNWVYSTLWLYGTLKLVEGDSEGTDVPIEDLAVDVYKVVVKVVGRRLGVIEEKT